ncbi:hypothetical protein D3C85_1651760 [compost metagenome]
MAFQADHRLARQILQRNVFLLGLQPAMGRQKLELALGDKPAMDVGVVGILQAQPQIAFAQQ